MRGGPSSCLCRAARQQPAGPPLARPSCICLSGCHMWVVATTMLTGPTSGRCTPSSMTPVPEGRFHSGGEPPAWA
eukprot:5066183-Lingulodinium_polyedra.AAC.1